MTRPYESVLASGMPLEEKATILDVSMVELRDIYRSGEPAKAYSELMQRRFDKERDDALGVARKAIV